MGSSGQKCLCIQSVSSSICCSLGSREGGGGGWTLGHSGLRRPLPHHHQDQVDKGAALVSSSVPLLLLIKRHSHLLALSSLAHNLPPAGSCHKFCSNVRCSTPELPVPQILFNPLLALDPTTWTINLLVLFTYVESFHFWLQSSDVLLS